MNLNHTSMLHSAKHAVN